jgi:hypothetical protein
VPKFCITTVAQNCGANVRQHKKLLPLVHQHQSGLLLHARQKHPPSTQGVKEPYIDWMEPNNEYPVNTDTVGEFVWATKRSIDVEQQQVVQIRLFSQQRTRIFVLACQTVSGGCNHCLQPIL